MKRKIIQVKQNTKEWREWRERGLGASDAPVVMGDSPWTSKFQLWAYKTGLLVRPEPNSYQVAAMQRGHDLEPGARSLYEKAYPHEGAYPSISFEHPTHEFLRASLDGFNAKLNKNLEIKCPGKADHAIAVGGKVPKKYMPQIQMQMLVSGAEETAYFSWDGKESTALILVKADPAYQALLMTEMTTFWEMVVKKSPPAIKKAEILEVLAIVRNDVDRINKSFKVLSLICEAITKGENDDSKN